MNIAKDSEKIFDIAGLRKAIARSVYAPNAKFVSRLMVTVKSHKEVLGYRNIHSSSM